MELRDCTWCGSAGAIEYGVCQVCLMWFPEDESRDAVVVSLDADDLEVETTPAEDRAAADAD